MKQNASSLRDGFDEDLKPVTDSARFSDTEKFIGFVGLGPQSLIKSYIEIGWRLASQDWGKGYATEVARAVLHKAFMDYELDGTKNVNSVEGHGGTALHFRGELSRNEFSHRKNKF